MNDLVQRLSVAHQPIVVGGAKPTLEDFKQRIYDFRYVFLTFTQTQGKTELGIRVDSEATDLQQANFESGRGIAHIEGTLTLNFTKVRCIADVDLSTLQGTGHLIALEEVHPLTSSH